VDSWRGTSVLVVDDDALNRELLRRLLEPRGHTCTLAADAAEARADLARESFALALYDITTPGESGLELVDYIVTKHQDTAVLIVSRSDEARTADAALGLGAYGYVIKPFRPKELLISVSAALRRRDAELESRRERRLLERRLEEQAAELRQSVVQLNQQGESEGCPPETTLSRLNRAITFRSHETGDHVERVGRYAGLLARLAGLGGARAEEIRQASCLHDIGKVAISDDVLLKPGPLTPDERREMERHADIGEEVLAGSDSPMLDLAATIAGSHPEWNDGSGYPRHLSGDEIPLEGRIAAIADNFDALTHDRVYRPAMPLDQALDTMLVQRGTHFDPELLDLFLDEADQIDKDELGESAA
jgi:putative two-component system response regulator